MTSPFSGGDGNSLSSHQQAMDILDTVEATAGILNPIAKAAAEATDRASFIGGSDVAAVMGLSPWTTPLELWLYKTRKKVREEDPSKKRIYARGHKLEPFIREMTVEKLQDMGLKVEVVSVNKRFVDECVPYFACEIDFQLRLTGVVVIGEEEVVFENTLVNCDAKSVTGFARKKWGDVGTDEVPIEYAAQFMFGLGITHVSYCLVAALRSFDDVDIFWVKEDAETILGMRAKCSQFWTEHVLKDVPPDPETFADLKYLFPKADPTKDMAVADDEMTDKVTRLARVKSAIKDLKEEEEVLAFDIQAAIGTNIGLQRDGRPLCTWNNERFNRLKQKELAAAHPEIAAAFADTGTQRVLRLKVK